MTTVEYGRHVAALTPAITDAQALEFAQIMLSDPERVAA